MTYTQSEYLTLLTYAPEDEVKALAEAILPELGEIKVLINRTGLVMLPYRDSAEGVVFHLGEVLVSEAHVEIQGGAQGYAVCAGRDLVQALAVALLDAALTAGIETARINTFLDAQARAQGDADDLLLRKVEATRVEMETF
ncbi:MAG: phosphonate C-P lyase system protein PhnG [Phototrophicales bacterium]|nr:MAG: phosphonate C-P lyase system protein PhnG [Phototrophicales bacterium]